MHSQDAPPPSAHHRAWLQLVGSSGSWLSREGFRELTSEHPPQNVQSFREFLKTGVEIEKRRTTLLRFARRQASPDPVELLAYWLEAHALGHLALLSFHRGAAWFSPISAALELRSWTPSYLLVRERIMSLAIRGAAVAGWLAADALPLYLPQLEKPGEPLEHFNAVLGLGAAATRRKDLRKTVSTAVREWVRRGSLQGGDVALLRKQIHASVDFLFDAEDEARVWSTEHSRELVAKDFTDRELDGICASVAISRTELLTLMGLNDTGDCGLFVDGLSPALLLLSHAIGREAADFYPPNTVVPLIVKPWAPEMSLCALGRSVC